MFPFHRGRSIFQVKGSAEKVRNRHATQIQCAFGLPQDTIMEWWPRPSTRDNNIVFFATSTMMMRSLVLQANLWVLGVLFCCDAQSASLEGKEEARVLREMEPTEESPFDLLCKRLETMPNFLCECVSEIPHRAIECQSTELCSSCNVCGRHLFQVRYMGPDISELQSCVTYTNIPADHPDYMDGCLTISYEGQDVPAGCHLSFIARPDHGLKECDSCTLCDTFSAETASASCDNVQPAATAECTSTHIESFFPGFRVGDCVATPQVSASKKVLEQNTTLIGGAVLLILAYFY